MTYSVIKTTFKCEEAKNLVYGNYSNVSQKCFQSDLLLNIWRRKKSYLELEKNFVKTLDKHNPKKTKIFRENGKPHSSKTLRKATMKRSQLIKRKPLNML